MRNNTKIALAVAIAALGGNAMAQFVIGGSVSGQTPSTPQAQSAASASAACQMDMVYRRPDGTLTTSDGRILSVKPYHPAVAAAAPAPRPAGPSPFVIGGSVSGNGNYVAPAAPAPGLAIGAIPTSGIGAYARTLVWGGDYKSERDSTYQFYNMAQASGWTVNDVSEAMGLPIADIDALMAKHGIPALQRRHTVSGAIGSSGINYFVKSLPWTGDVQADRVSTHAVYDMAITSGWTANDVASAMGFTPAQINAHLAQSGLPPLPTR